MSRRFRAPRRRRLVRGTQRDEVRAPVAYFHPRHVHPEAGRRGRRPLRPLALLVRRRLVVEQRHSRGPQRRAVEKHVFGVAVFGIGVVHRELERSSE